MSRWESVLNRILHHPQDSLDDLVETIFEFCSTVGISLKSDNVDDLSGELDSILGEGKLDEAAAEKLRTFVEAFKKMIFTMLDKTKKTVTASDDEDERLESKEWVAYVVGKKDPMVMDSKGVMSLSKEQKLILFPSGTEVPAAPDRKLVWSGKANLATDALMIARRSMKESVTERIDLFLEGAAGTKVTIYSKGVVGNIIKTEGVLTAVSDHGISYIPKRARKERMIMSYYSPFWMVVEGFGHPEPDSLWGSEETNAETGVTVSKGRYSGFDPKWTSDFMDRIGSKLGSKVIAIYDNKSLKIHKPQLIPAKKTEDIVSRIDDVLEAAATGVAQKAIMSYLGRSGKSAEVALADLHRDPSLRGVHFQKIVSGAEALAKKGLITYDGDKVKLAEETEEEEPKVEVKEVPAMAFPGEDEPTRRGAFKLSSKALRLFKQEVPEIDNPSKMLFKSQRKVIDDIPREDLPKVFGKDNMADAQDVLAHSPKRAFQMWMRNVHKVSPKLHKMLQQTPGNASLYFYGFMLRVVGKDMADIILKRYFETDSDHPGTLNKKKAAQEEVRRLAKALREAAVHIFAPGPSTSGGSDADTMCKEIEAGLRGKIGGSHLQCRVDTRFGGGTVFVDYASAPAGSSHLDVLNAEKSVLLSVGPFDEAGLAKGDKLKMTVVKKRGMKVMGKTGSVEKLTSHIISAIGAAAK